MNNRLPLVLLFLAPAACTRIAFTGIAAGDATPTAAILWTRLDDASPAHTGITAPLSVQLSTDNITFQTVLPSATNTGPDHDFTFKTELTHLTPNTTYFYRFVSASTTSPTGTFKTAPDPTAAAPLRIAFSGDAHGSWRPYGMTRDFAALHLDAFIFLGDTMYETASAGANPSPAAPLSTTPAATPDKILAEYHRKYREQFLPVTTSPPSTFASLSTFYQSQGVYTLLDNHELGNKQYQCGGASLAGPLNNIPGTDAGIDGKNPAFDVNATQTFINKTKTFQNMVQAYTDYMPIRDQFTSPSLLLNTPADPRIHGTLQQFNTRQWGKNVMLFNVDDRSYRDIRLLTAGAKDDAGPRADNPNRTMLGTTQFSILKLNLLVAQTTGIPWKIILISSPIDQTSPIPQTSAPSALNLPKDPNAPSLESIKDGGKSWIGGYRAQRNDLLKFIADNHITNVVFLSTDDHCNRVNELSYSPTGNTADQSTYVRVPTAFEIIAGPMGADGAGDRPNDHAYAHIAAEATNIAQAQIAAHVDPLGLDPAYPGLHHVFREHDPNLAPDNTIPLNRISPVDFYSPDTFNFAQLDISPDGKELTVTTWGIDSYAENLFPNPATLPKVRPILSFQITAQ